MNSVSRLLIGLSLIFLPFGEGICQNLNNLSFGSDDAFDIATWNLEAFPKNGMITVDSVRKAISALEFDVLGLQEINDTVALRQMVEQMPGYGFFIAEGFYAGLAYVYRTDAIEIQSMYKIYDAFPYWNTFPRAPVVMELIFQGQPLIVINNHLKCCGDGQLDLEDEMDEENRRYQASLLLKQYIDENIPGSKVFVIGDLNDLLTDLPPNNVFQNILNDTDNYLFADLSIAQGTSSDWSYPLWPSHLDHILITDELFDDFENSNSSIQTIKIDNFISGGLWQYDEIISDHRPVALKIDFDPVTTVPGAAAKIRPTLYPNPTQERFWVDLGKHHSSADLAMIDTKGKTVRVWRLTHTSRIELEADLSPGAYILLVNTGESTTALRLMIQ